MNDIVNILYLLCIAPIELLMRLLLELGNTWTHSWGWALVLLSLVVNIAILPIYNWAERRQEEERQKRRGMATHEAMIHRTFKGEKRFALLSVLRRQRGYGYGFTLCASLGLLLQIPFFIAACHLLLHFDQLNEYPFGFLVDLGKPDALFSIGGVTVNVLPFLMTVVNLASAFVYTSGLTRHDKVQIYGMALLFLLLLYNAPASLTLYWTLNNVFSLGKNVVEKDWMQRPGWRRFWASRGATARRHRGRAIRRRFLRVIACSLGVGLAFCLYLSTLVWVRQQYELSDNLLAAIRHIAEQSLVAALAAGLALFLLAPSRPLLLVGATVALFIMQPELIFFLVEYANERLYFFDVWNNNGYFVFITWIVTIVLIRRYWDEFTRFGEKLFHIFCRWLERQALKRVQPEFHGPLVASTSDSIILAILAGGVCGAFFCYFIPFSTYLYNVKEFEFNGFMLFRILFPYFLIVFSICSLIFYTTNLFFYHECVKMPWRKAKHLGARVNIFYIISIIILILVWLEGSVLSYGLPLLNGRSNLFNSVDRMFFDSSILLLLCAIFIKFKDYLYKNIFILYFFVILFSSTTLVNNYYEGNKRKLVNDELGAYGLRVVNRETLFSQFRFSKNANIIILVVDSLDSLAFEKTIETSPELASVFDGFWFFKENLGVGGARTDLAMPQILSGNIYDGDRQAFRNFSHNSILSNDSMLADARKEGMNVFVDIDYSCVIGDDRFNKSFIITENDFLKKTNIYRLVFKFLPYTLKSVFQDAVNINIRPSNVQICNNSYCLDNVDINKEKFNMMLNSFGSYDEKTVFSIIHFHGVHIPFVKSDLMQSTREYIKDLEKFIYFLKDINIYDKSTFIVMADHGPGYGQDSRKLYPERKGTYSTVYFPVLLVKIPDAKGDMIIREDLMSSSYVRGLLKQFYLNGYSASTMSAFLDTLPETRKIFNGYPNYYPEIGTFEAVGTFSTLKIGGR